MTHDVQTIIETLSLLSDWEEKYKYIIELGQELPPYPNEFRDRRHKISGCVSQVWLHCYIAQKTSSSSVYYFNADSDSHMVRGLLAIILAFYNGRTADEIKSVDLDHQFQQLNLKDNLTPQRSSGVYSVIKHIKNLV